MEAGMSDLWAEKSRTESMAESVGAGRGRVAVFALTDPQGTVGGYVEYLLKDIRENVSKLHVAVGGQIDPDGADRLNVLADSVTVLSDVGSHFGAWKHLLRDPAVQADIAGCDELWLVADTFYGPFVPLLDISNVMAGKDVDFWGISQGRLIEDPKDKPIDPANGYVEPYFLAMRQALLSAPEFSQFWDSVEDDDTTDQALSGQAVAFTRRFSDLGFSWATYVNACDDVFEGNNGAISLTTYVPGEMVRNRKLPVLTRDSLTLGLKDSLYFTDGVEARRAIDYVKHHTDYPVSLIWQDLLSRFPMCTLKDSLHLNFILDASENSQYEIDAVPAVRVAVIAVVYYEDILEEVLRYLTRVPRFVKVVVATSNEAILPVLHRRLNEMGVDWEVRPKPNRGRELSALLVACQDILHDYDLLCFVHDKKSHAEDNAFTVGRDFRQTHFENLLGSESYVRRVVDLFRDDENLGMLFPPLPRHSRFFGVVGGEWTDNLQNTKELLRRGGVSTQITEEDTPFGLGSAFWCRTVALKKLIELNWQYSDFPDEPMPHDGTLSHSLERAFMIVAQDAGYYSGVVMTSEFASMAASRDEGMFRQVNWLLRKSPSYCPVDVDAYTGFVDGLVSSERKLLAIYGSRLWPIGSALARLFQRVTGGRRADAMVPPG